MSDNIHHTGDFWLRLDNAAKIYPAIRDRELTAVFRISVQLKERIKVKQLQQPPTHIFRDKPAKGFLETQMHRFHLLECEKTLH